MHMQPNSMPVTNAEVGPLKYIAKITGLSMDIIVNWLIILLIIVFDPLAVILLISANKAFDLTVKDSTH